MALSARERARERAQWVDSWKRNERREIAALYLFSAAVVLGVAGVVLGTIALVEGWL